MSLSLRALLAVLLLAVSLPAFAGPDDLFDAAAANAFQAGQREFILALDAGRYAITDGHVVDGRSKAALTNAQVAALFPAGGGAGADVNPKDEEGVQRARALNGGTAPGNFDGSVQRPETIDGPPPTQSASTPAPVDPAVLHTQLLNRLVFKGTPREKAAISEAVTTMLRTRTGRELAAQFVAERASAEIEMGVIPGSAIVVKDGRRINSGSGGNTSVHLDPPRVTLNKDYLDSDPEYRRVAMAGTLAHELFGHGFATQRARKERLPLAVNYYYRGDEISSEFVGWLVETELSGRVIQGDPDSYLADPEQYHRGLWSNMPYYVLILSPAEMRDPLPVLKARGAALKASRLKTIKDRADMGVWTKVLEHFVTIHKILRARFKPAEDYLFRYDHWAESHLQTLVEIESTLERKIAHWSSAAGAAELAQVKAAGRSDYLRRAEGILAGRRAELERLRAQAAAGTAPRPMIPLPSLVIKAPGDPNSPLEFMDLVEMQSQDVKTHPEHWIK